MSSYDPKTRTWTDSPTEAAKNQAFNKALDWMPFQGLSHDNTADAVTAANEQEKRGIIRTMANRKLKAKDQQGVGRHTNITTLLDKYQ